MVQAFPFYTKLTNSISLSFYGHHFEVNENLFIKVGQ